MIPIDVSFNSSKFMPSYSVLGLSISLFLTFFQKYLHMISSLVQGVGTPTALVYIVGSIKKMRKRKWCLCETEIPGKKANCKYEARGSGPVFFCTGKSQSRVRACKNGKKCAKDVSLCPRFIAPNARALTHAHCEKMSYISTPKLL